MKIIIAGGRDIIIPTWLIKLKFQKHNLVPSEVISGACGLHENEIEINSTRLANGIDGCGESWALENKLPITRFPAQWSQFGCAAGPIRNEEMATYADALLVIWDGKSRGSFNMISCMRELGKPVFEIIVSDKIPHKRIKSGPPK